MARPLPGPSRGPRKGARPPLQHRRRPAHGAGDRSAAPRPVDRLPLHAHRRRRARPRRPYAHGQDQSPVVPVWPARGRHRPALLRRGGGRPALHLRQARGHDPEPAACLQTLEGYNAAVESGTFDPSIRDGLATKGLALPKSNWAQRLDTPPFTAWPVTGGITFTFGGVRVDERAQVQSTAWTPIPGLYACGEMVGGLFHGNYPGGTGLISGAVFGRIAG